MDKIVSKKGFTIVEVLIAITVLSFSLAMGFAVAGKSNQSLQANKEQFQAQQVANQQIEYLRSTNAGLISGLRNGFLGPDNRCFVNTSGVYQVKSGTDCANISGGGGDIYTIRIRCVNAADRTYIDCNTNANVISVYSIVVSWQNIKGGQSKVELQYAM